MNDDQKQKESPKSTDDKISFLTKDFCEHCTLHGLRNVFTSDHVVLRLAWLVLVLLAFGWLVNCSIRSVIRYLDYPTTINIKEKVYKELPFPAVTICSQNFADKHKIYARDNETDFQKYKLNISACAATAKVRGPRPCGHALVCAFVWFKVVLDKRIIDCSESYQNATRKAMKKSNVTFNLLEFLHTFGESWNEVVRFCSYGYKGNLCGDTKNFKHSIKNERLCHTLNDVDQTMSIASDVPGSGGGIYLLMKANRPDRNFYPRFAEGFAVYIHQKGAGFGNYEINVPPGKLTSIAVERERFLLLEEGRGGQCAKRSLQGYTTYTQTDCYEECINNMIEAQCGCRVHSAKVYHDSITCDAPQMDCAGNASLYASFDECDCPLACETTRYKTSVTYGVMPNKSIVGVSQILPDPDYSPQNFLSVTVFYGSHREVTYEQRRTFSAISLLGEIGGNMGLYLGCSVITLVEFIFLFFSLLSSYFSRENKVANRNIPS